MRQPFRGGGCPRQGPMLSGYNIGRGGKLQLVEPTGPSNFDMWKLSFQVFANATMMLDQAPLGS